jgi:adenylate cyclase, class 2
MAENEVEIKFAAADLKSFERKLKQAGFRQETPRTHELNTLYDLPGGRLRKRGELLRLRQYGKQWVLTHKGKTTEGRHKKREETETAVKDGAKMDAILRRLGYRPSFRYEKFRAEWSDGQGKVVLDETPIENLGEIEGKPRWIDDTARKLGIDPENYITSSYAELFFAWKKRTRSSATEMTFRAVGGRAKRG